MALGSILLLPDGRAVHQPTYLLSTAGYVRDPLIGAAEDSTVVSDAMIATPRWYYRALYNPGQVASYVDPITTSLLPTINTIDDDPWD